MAYPLTPLEGGAFLLPSHRPQNSQDHTPIPSRGYSPLTYRTDLYFRVVGQSPIGSLHSHEASPITPFLDRVLLVRLSDLIRQVDRFSWYVFVMVPQFWRLVCSLVVLLALCSCTAAQEGALRKFLQNYAASSDYGEIKATRYFAAFVHLRDDNTQQVIVYLIGDGWCGTGGCRTLILVLKDSSYAVLTEMTVVQQPIRVLDTKSNGWRDLGVWVQGGGIQPGYEARLSFNGKEYPSNPTVPPAEPLTTKVRGKVVVPRSATGEPLYRGPEK